MKGTEPPPLAARMLEHCTPSGGNEALAGDLLEEFRSGRSDGWYWRQVLAACAVSWTESLRTRTTLLIFALMWSMLAPAWKIFIDGLENAPFSDRILLSSGGFWILPAFGGWLVLNSTFLWAGIIVYTLTLSSCGKVIRGNKIKQALLFAPLVFAPVFGAWFALCMLDWTFPFATQTLATTPWGQIADLRLLADVMRFPYLITLVSVLWNAIPQSKQRSQLVAVDSIAIESPAQSGAPTLLATLDTFAVKRFLGFVVCAGLINAMIAGILLCRLPDSQSPTLSSLLVRSILHVVIGVVAGVGGCWLYWKNPSSPFRERSPIPFPLFALVCASGWIWVAPMVIFSEQLSVATAFVAAIGAAFLAIGLRSVTSSVYAPAPYSASYESENVELFSQTLHRIPWEAQGYVITFLLYAGGCALAMRSNLAAAALFALCAFLFAWKRALAPSHELDNNQEYRRAALRLAYVALPATLVTVWALLDGVAHRNHLAEVTVVRTDNGSSATDGAKQMSSDHASATGIGGYESVILWPFPEKKRVIPPLMPQESLLSPGTVRPLIIPFDGTYWYIQPPKDRPGPAAHQARGTPLGVDIESKNAVPLVMEAHQILGASIRTARCRSIQVEIESRDNKAGVIAMAVLLADTASPEKPALYLGQQPIVSTEPEHFSIKTIPASETLYFAVPESVKGRKFNEITVMLLPDVEHALVAPKIAIRQFQLFPR